MQSYTESLIRWRLHHWSFLLLAVLLGWCAPEIRGFQSILDARSCRLSSLDATKGFGSGGGDSSSVSGKKKKSKTNRLLDSLQDKPKPTATNTKSVAKPYVKKEQDQLLEQLAQRAAQTPIGRAVQEFAPIQDPFWELMPSLIASKFPALQQRDLERIAGFVRHSLATATAAVGPIRPEDWIDDPYRPYDELHAYMPNLGPTKPFHDPATMPLCKLMEDNYDTICKEYQALLDNGMQDKFQSVTSLNYESGWKTLVLFYNSHRIPDFPYHLCPVTTKILETVPLAGRIAGFNRQQPGTGIPLHTDGNNMWLTCQMGIVVPDNEQASIRVGPETRHWQAGQCLLYDTTYQHETMNQHPTQERVVLHVDFFNTLALTPVEIDIMQYIYTLREQFMKAEGVAKVGAQIL
jgi:aspartyl/asparaginyl beta-hydroxylase (cupin superfamily)